MVKKLLALLCIVFLVVCIGAVPAFAAMEPFEITYNIHSDNENDIMAEPGDIVTVTFVIERTDSEEDPYELASYQNEIEYDMDFFELLEDSVDLSYGLASGATPVQDRLSGQRIVKVAQGTGNYAKKYVACTFDLEVVATSGSGTVRSSKAICSAWDYTVDPAKAIQNSITQRNLTVTIDPSSIIPVESVTLTPSSATLVAVGETLTLIPAVTPANASNKSVTYSSSDESVATVNDDGVVTAVANGTAVITVTTVDGGKTAVCNVTVDIPPATVSVTGVRISPTIKTLEIRDTFQLEVTVLPADATDKSVIFTSSNSSVATVSDTGLVTAKAKGKTTITVTTVDGEKTATCVITVKASDGGGGGGGGGGSEKYILSFEVNGGMEITDLKAKEGTKISLDNYVTDKAGFEFQGWYTDAEFTNRVTEIVLEKNITIYAKWVAVESEDDEKEPEIVVKPDYKPEILTDEHYAYIIGREGGIIAPNSDITRAEVATIIYRLLDEEVRNKTKTTQNVFVDVNENDWFNTAVSTLAALELVNGRTLDTFAPKENITRAELATIFARMVEVEYDGKALFSDVSGHWAESYINEASTAGWIVGYNGLFRPDDNITRAEVMTLVNRVLNREPESKADLLDGMTTWKDNADENAWYYVAVQEATNSHEYQIKADGVHEKWTSLKENPDWDALEK